MGLNAIEIFWFIGIFSEFLIVLIWGLFSKQKLKLSQPPVFYGLVITYYCLVGILYSAFESDFVSRGTDFRSGLNLALKGGFISYGSFLIAYFIKNKKLKKIRYTSINPKLALRLGRFINSVSIFLFFLVAGPSMIYYMNPLNIDIDLVSGMTRGGSGGLLGPFSNYGSFSINLLIPGTLLVSGYYFKTKKGLIELIMWFFISFSIYTSLAFRYRILLLILGVFNINVFSKRQFNIYKYAFLLIGLALLLGFIGEFRNYGAGLNINLTDYTFLSIFKESKMILTTGKFMEAIPEKVSFVGLKPIFNTLIAPIPSFFLENKDNIDYLRKVLTIIYGSEERSKGASLLNFAEYYYMFGWFSVISISFIIGRLYKFLWDWFNLRKDEIIAQVIYTTSLLFIYVLISRGAMPQSVMIYFFTVVPIIYYYYKVSKKNLNL